MERKTREELHAKAMLLPLSPGVYIMRSVGGKIVYIGKSRALRNRVSQYFGDTEKNVKTAAMVASVWDFDYILTNTEIEALALENKLIKLHTPRYNILLKDGKNYPYIKLTVAEDFPRVEMSRKRLADKSRYFGPYSSAVKAFNVIGTVNSVFKLPTCKRVFPRDIGKERPCIYKDIGRCMGVCNGQITKELYKENISGIVSFLKGSIKSVQKEFEEKMRSASLNLEFEAAAIYRDRLNALKMLWDKQMIIGSPNDEFDIISIYKGELSSCIAVYYVREGAVIDSDNFVFGADKIIDENDIVCFLCDLYKKREDIPSLIYADLGLSPESIDMMNEYLKSECLSKSTVKVPIIGEHKKLCTLVMDNAKNHADQYVASAEKDNGILIKLAQMLSLEVIPDNIEAIDISNYGNESITAGIISVKSGKFNKSAYRLYKIRTTDGQNDYGAMREAIKRRIDRRNENPLPDLLLLDGGDAHVSVIKTLLTEEGIDLPVFGMVKDDFHKTRAITGGDCIISIAHDQSVYTFIYKIQEEVHRFSIRASSSDKSRKLKRSSLENIEGIGAKKARLLLDYFKSIKAIKEASASEIASVKGISKANGDAVREYFDNNK